MSTDKLIDAWEQVHHGLQCREDRYTSYYLRATGIEVTPLMEALGLENTDLHLDLLAMQRGAERDLFRRRQIHDQMVAAAKARLDAQCVIVEWDKGA